MTTGNPPNIKVPGVVGSIPQGYLLGRISPGTGPVQLVKLSDLLQSSSLGKLNGSAAPLALAPIPDGDVLANISGTSSAPIPTEVSALLDHIFGSAQGDILVRKATGWAALVPGTTGAVLTTNGAGADPSWSGQAGQYLESVINISGSNTGYVNTPLATVTDITSLTLPAGEWDVWGTILWSSAGTTTTSLLLGWINTASSTQPTYPNGGAVIGDTAAYTITAATQAGTPVGKRRYSFSVQTTIYLSAYVAGTGGAPALAGGLYAKQIVAASLGGGGGGSAGPNPFVATQPTAPAAADFTVTTVTSSGALGVTGTLTNLASGRGMLFKLPGFSGSSTFATWTTYATFNTAPNTTAFTVTAMLMVAGGFTIQGVNQWGLEVYDGTKGVGICWPGSWSNSARPTANYFTQSSNTANLTTGAGMTIGSAQGPIWLRIQLSSGNLIYSISFDGETFEVIKTTAATASLGTPTAVRLVIQGENSSPFLDQNIDVFAFTLTTP